MQHAFTEIATDGAGRFVLAIASADKEGNTKFDRLEVRTPPFDPGRAIKDFSAILREHKIGTLMADRHATHWAKEQFRIAAWLGFCGLRWPDRRNCWRPSIIPLPTIRKFFANSPRCNGVSAVTVAPTI